MVHSYNFEKARELGELERLVLPYAISAYHRDERIFVLFNNGVEIGYPVRWLQGLQTATLPQLTNIEITPTGQGLIWPDLDVCLSVKGLIEGRFGSSKWMRRLETCSAALITERLKLPDIKPKSKAKHDKSEKIDR